MVNEQHGKNYGGKSYTGRFENLHVWSPWKHC